MAMIKNTTTNVLACHDSKKPHAIMISYTLQGHIIPYVNLALKLASNGFSITFAHLEFVHYSISKSQQYTSSTTDDIFAKARASGLDISYMTISDGFPVEFERGRNLDKFLPVLLGEFPDKADAFVKNVIQAHSGSRCFLISDAFYEWPLEVAKWNNLVNVSFWSEPALVYSLYYHRELLMKNGHVPVNGRQENVSYLPGIESINTKDFMSHYQHPGPDLIDDSIFSALDTAKKADFVLGNSVEELEIETVSALRENQPFYPIGPLISLHFQETSVPRNLLPESDCTEWLKGKPIGSVLYISFGSMGTTANTVNREIASGLILCEVNFIWVLRPGMLEDSDSATQILPPGFDDRTKGRGVVVPWCDQSQILSDPAIGGFLTHCGWNSILESIWCGIPMLCYPVFTDQPTNRKLVVDDWRIGMNLCDGDQDVKGDKVAETIMSFMNGERSDELKREIKKVREKMQSALAEDGSSVKNLDSFVHDVVAEVEKRCKGSELSV